MNSEKWLETGQTRFFYFCFSAFSLGIAILETSLALFVLIQMIFGLLSKSGTSRIFAPGRRMACLLMTGLIASAVLAQYRDSFQGETSIHWAFVAYWAISALLLKKLDWIFLHRMMLAVSVPGLIYSVYWLLRPDEIAHSLNVGFHMYPRASGLVSNPITNAEGLVIIGCWTFARLGSTEMTPKERKLLMAHLGLSVLIIVFSRVRAGLVGISVLLLLGSWLFPAMRRFSIFIWGGMAAAFVAGIFLFSFNTESLQERKILLENGIRIIKEHPLIGIGPNRFEEHAMEGAGTKEHPHNTIIAMTAESGLIGLAIYLAFMWVIAKNLMTIRKRHQAKDDPLHWLTTALLLVFVTYWVFGLFDYNWGDSELLIFHSYHWALITNLALHSETLHKEKE